MARTITTPSSTAASGVSQVATPARLIPRYNVYVYIVTVVTLQAQQYQGT